MSEGDDKPWDARLVEWMSRGSSEARSRRRGMGPIQRAVWAAIAISYLAIETAPGGAPLWLLVVYLAIAVVVQCSYWIYERRHRT
ncbi:MAG TPA: hypothetical protein VGF47_03185 [Solirubrobacteraceae bacterium]